MLNAESIAMSLDKPRRSGPGKYMACCPTHDDKNPSLAITDADGTTLIYCFAGCQQRDVIDALRARGLWPEAKKDINSGPSFSKNDLLELRFYVELAKSASHTLSNDETKKLAACIDVLNSKGVAL